MAMSVSVKPGEAYRNRVRAGVSPKECEAIYDKWAATFSQDMGAEVHGYVAPALTAQLAVKFSNDLSDRIILDAGCGTGMVGQALKSVGANVIDGVDFSTGMLEGARQTNVYRNLARADLSKPISQADQMYDIVTCVGTLTSGHVGPVPALAEFVRITKKGGIIITTILADIWESAGFRAEVDRLKAEKLVSVLSDDVVDYVKGYGDRAVLLALKRDEKSETS